MLAPNFLELEYDSIKWGIINDKTNNRLVCFLYEREGSSFKYTNIIRIHGYYPRQIRKIIFTITERLKNDGEYKKAFLDRGIDVSKNRSESFKRFQFVQNMRSNKQG